jgi:hypothetical protein
MQTWLRPTQLSYETPGVVLIIFYATVIAGEENEAAVDDVDIERPLS